MMSECVTTPGVPTADSVVTLPSSCGFLPEAPKSPRSTGTVNRSWILVSCGCGV